MWTGNKIYFISDRDENKRFNLYSYDTGTRRTQKFTSFTEFDIKFPSLGNDAIVFENGGYIYRLDLKSEKAEKIPISIADDGVSGRGSLMDVTKFISNYEIAPDGNRALFGARGDIFTVPVKFGNTRNLTKTSGVHERASKWSPDGKWIAYISDASGEDEIYLIPQDGSAPGKQLTKGADTYKFPLMWSPDSSKILWSDKKLRLQYVDVSTGAITTIAQATAWEITDFAWSPDSKWVAFAQPEEKKMEVIYLFCGQKGKPGGNGRLVRFDRAFLQCERQVSLFCLGSDVQSHLRPDRVQLCLPGHGKDLSADAGERNQVSLRAQERRGQDRGDNAGDIKG
jgi:tricorn protease